jgi:prepilin-type N-terminal cleavage/methylation domain-containing protein
MEHKIKKQSGFSLIETMAAVLIIVIGMVGVLSLVAQNIKAQNINKNELIASQLAQEGLEITRWKRDRSLASGSNWQNFKNIFINGGSFDGSFIIDYFGNIKLSVDIIDEFDAKLNINNAADFYCHYSMDSTNCPSNPSIFSRLIEITDNVDYLDVKCTVQWQERGQPKQYVASTLLYDWR